MEEESCQKNIKLLQSQNTDFKLVNFWVNA